MTAHPATPPRPASSRFCRALERRVCSFVHRQRLLSAGQHVLAAVSGGPDSTCLAMVLARLRGNLGVRVTLAHFDHMLRSRRQAVEEARYVQHLAEALRLPVVFGQGDVRAHARAARQGLEEAGRYLRYAFLARQAQELEAEAVATGHTRSDQAETVLLHIVRGSGLDGLAGMRPRTPWPFGQGPVLVRPLLHLSRWETERYCREAGLEPREDPTNRLMAATRNRIRHQVLPLLRTINPRVEEALARLAEAAALDAAHLAGEVEAAWGEVVQLGEGRVSFRRDRLAGLPPALAVRLLRRAISQLRGPAAEPEAVHLEALLALLDNPPGHLSLPGGVTAVWNGKTLSLTLGEPVSSPPIPERPLNVPGQTELPGWIVEAEVVEVPSPLPKPTDPLEAWLDADAVSPVAVRSRRPGDRLRPLGLGGEKKVQDILVDAKVPREERDAVPVVCAPWGVAWVVGHRIDERAALTPSSQRALRLRFRRRSDGA